jgi:6-phosphogluconolactonase
VKIDGSVRLIIAADQEEWSDRAADHFLEIAKRAAEARGACHLVVPGGRTPRLAFGRVTERLAPADPLWSHLHVYFGDERHVAADHPDSNVRMIQDALLTRASVPEEQVHRIEGELEPEEAASRYAAVLEPLLGRLPTPSGDGGFDLVVLGLGPDGHVASLIPGQPLDFVAGSWVGVGPAPLSPARVRRITLTAPALRSTRELTLWVRGADKAEAVRQALAGGPATMVPAVTPPGRPVTWILDRDAAAAL